LHRSSNTANINLNLRRTPAVRYRSIFLLVLLVASLAFATTASRSARADSPAPAGGVVEEVRYGESNGLIVEHRVLIDSSVAADPPAVADALTGISDNSSTVTAQYALNSWRWPASAMPVPVSFNPSDAGSAPSAEPWITAAVGQWSAITTAFRFTYAGTTTAGLGACVGDGTPDGINTIGFTKGMERGVLAQTCTLSTNAGKLVEFDMQLNSDTNWGDGTPLGASQYDLPSTILHEMGHAAALGHPCPLGQTSQCTDAERASVMYPSIARGQMKRTLQPDDIAGLKAQYPSGSTLPTPPASPTPTALPTPVPTLQTGLPPYQRNFEVFTVAVAHD
jgi:Matrixin